MYLGRTYLCTIELPKPEFYIYSIRAINYNNQAALLILSTVFMLASGYIFSCRKKNVSVLVF